MTSRDYPAPSVPWAFSRGSKTLVLLPPKPMSSQGRHLGDDAHYAHNAPPSPEPNPPTYLPTSGNPPPIHLLLTINHTYKAGVYSACAVTTSSSPPHHLSIVLKQYPRLTSAALKPRSRTPGV